VCDLCLAEKLTKWYYEDDICWIADCKSCKIPMLVFKQHTMKVPLWEVRYSFIPLILGLFGSKVRLRFQANSCKGHFHIHIYKQE